MDLNSYIGQYIKVVTQDQEWFIGELLSVKTQENDSLLGYELNILSSSKDRKSIKGKYNTDRNEKKNTGIHILPADEIAKIEELDPGIQQGIRLTLTNVPDIREAFHSMDLENIPSRIVFGKINDSE